MNKEQMEIARNKRVKIVEYLKKYGKPATKQEIINATGVNGIFDSIMRDIRIKYPQVQKEGTSRSTKYVWIDDKIPVATKITYKNSEGYNDGTANKAIANVMRTSNGKYPERQGFGEIWKTKTGQSDVDKFLVISATDGVAIGLFVHESRKGFMKAVHTFTWSDGGMFKKYASVLHIVNYQTDRLISKVGELTDEKKNELAQMVVRAIGLKPEKEVQVVEKPIEKIVEKPVEVEKIIEKPIGMSDAEVEKLLMEQKIEIYERILFKRGA